MTQQPQRPVKQDEGALVADLVIANHILADQDVVDGFGHVSVRSASNPQRYFISRSRAPAMVTAEDILEYDLEDNAIEAGGRSSYVERFIHSEIYKARPDVLAVVHSHSPSVVPFGATTIPLRPISHMGGFLIREVPVFEIRQFGGDETDMLVRDKKLGEALARTLGGATTVLMRGHGDTVVGQTLKHAVAHAIYTEFNARIQMQAMTLGGPVTFLNEKEAANVAAINDASVERPWEIWKKRVT